ncbi:MAG TPA: EamA family transporter [Oceanospirillaceae bacterium]|nr:EamA family transporter [Oceanospirillaceae bacterium]
MHNKVALANVLMLLAAAIWGFAFVAQRVGMETMGPHLFNGVRFIMGGLVLLPVVYWLSKRRPERNEQKTTSTQQLLLAGLLAGSFLFAGATLQQVGLQYTTAGKAGFITGLYIFFVPAIGLCFGMRTSLGTWLGAILAIWGLYLLSVRDDFTLSRGDTFQLLCAIAFAGHVLVIGFLAGRYDTIKLSAIQFLVAGVLAFIVAIFTETITWQMIVDTVLPLAYAGLMSTGVAYTLQVVAQQHAHSSHAAIILSSEGVFAVLGGWLFLSEQLPIQGLLGCGLMLAGMLLSQLWPTRKA